MRLDHLLSKETELPSRTGDEAAPIQSRHSEFTSRALLILVQGAEYPEAPLIRCARTTVTGPAGRDKRPPMAVFRLDPGPIAQLVRAHA